MPEIEIPRIQNLTALAYVRRVHKECLEEISEGKREERWGYHNPTKLKEAIDPLIEISEAYLQLASGVTILRDNLGRLEEQMTVETTQIVKIPEKKKKTEKGRVDENKPEEITVSKKDYIFIPSHKNWLVRSIGAGLERINQGLEMVGSHDGELVGTRLESDYWRINDAIVDCYKEKKGVRVFVAIRSLRDGTDSLRRRLFPTPYPLFKGGPLWGLEENMQAYITSLRELRKFVEGKTEIAYNYSSEECNRVEKWKEKKKKTTTA